MLPRFLSFSLILLCAARCTLHPSPPLVRVTVALPHDKAPIGRGTRAPEISAMSCLGVVVKGGPNPVGSSQTGSRNPVCLGLNGSFFGPYTPEELQNSVSLTLSSGSYEFSVVGFKASDCGSLPSLYLSSPAAETYLVTSPVAVDTTTTTSVSLDSRTYSPGSAIDRTVQCPPAGANCTDAIACDRFIDTDGKPLTSHVMDVGTGWSAGGFAAQTIVGNHFQIYPAGDSFAGMAFFITYFPSRDVVLSLNRRLGFGAKTSVGLIARFSTFSDMVTAGVTRDDELHTCGMSIVETVGGNSTAVGGRFLQYPSQCSDSVLDLVTFTLRGTEYVLTVAGEQLQYSLGTPALAGISVGFYGYKNGTPVLFPQVDFFKASMFP